MSSLRISGVWVLHFSHKSEHIYRNKLHIKMQNMHIFFEKKFNAEVNVLADVQEQMSHNVRKRPF